MKKLCLILAILGGSCAEHDDTAGWNHKVWFEYPAKYWNSQALHLGNSYFGASFFGGIKQEVFSMTDASMWTGAPANGEWESGGINPAALASMPVIREAVIAGRIKEADSLIDKNVFGTPERYGHFTSIGDLLFDFAGQEAPHKDYIRTLDLANSVGNVEYSIDGTTYKREYFCSYPDQMLVLKFSATEPGSISFGISMDIIQDSSWVEINGNEFRLSGLINGNQRPFEVLIRVQNEGGELGEDGKRLTLTNATAAVVYVTSATNYEMRYPDYVGDDPDVTNRERMRKAVEKGFEELKTRHRADYQGLYDRVKLELAGNPEVEKLPTNVRFENLKEGANDIGYKELAYNLGKYMIISSSRPNSLPANLQGVWNAFEVAPWAGNYQSNINLQEIYWSCGPMDLLECQQPYVDWIEDLAHTGREVAARIYGTNGWVSHTTGNIWGHASPWGSHPWGMFPQGASWHCQHLWDQFLFNQDIDYLKDQAYPLMKEASIFWLENLVSFEGYLISVPTVSAEHGALITDQGLNPAFHDYRSDQYVYSLPGVYQDIEMIWELFTNSAEAARLVGDNSFSDRLIDTREQLLPLKIGRLGQLQEWYADIDNPETHHRHIAHLYAVAPGTMIHPTVTPKLAAAAKISLDMRGDGRDQEQENASGGNWARAHRMWAWTRLMDGNRANKILTELLTEQGFENGLTFQHATYSMGRDNFAKEGDLFLHYQLDATASIPGCIAEMLLQSHLGELHLLPALPDEFESGTISGLKARGGFKLDIEWENGLLVHAKITKPSGTEMPPIRLVDKIIDPVDFENIQIVDL